MIEAQTCDRSKEKAMISKLQSMSISMQSMIETLENKIYGTLIISIFGQFTTFNKQVSLSIKQL